MSQRQLMITRHVFNAYYTRMCLHAKSGSDKAIPNLDDNRNTENQNGKSSISPDEQEHSSSKTMQTTDSKPGDPVVYIFMDVRRFIYCRKSDKIGLYVRSCMNT